MFPFFSRYLFFLAFVATKSPSFRCAKKSAFVNHLSVCVLPVSKLRLWLIRLSVCQSVCQSVCTSVHHTVCLLVYRSVCLSANADNVIVETVAKIYHFYFFSLHLQVMMYSIRIFQKCILIGFFYNR